MPPDAKNQTRKEELKRLLESEQQNIDRMREQISGDNARWNKEIALLESRVYTETLDVDLGNGALIALRACLSAVESERLDDLFKAHKKAPEGQEREAIACDIIELITANPDINKEWLMVNRDKYSPVDVQTVLMGFLEVRLKERRDHFLRLQSAYLFRPEPSGT